MLYKECPYCGANLDPGERCDCPGVRGEKNVEYRVRHPPVPASAYSQQRHRSKAPTRKWA